MSTITLPPNPDATCAEAPIVKRAEFDGGKINVAPQDARSAAIWNATWDNFTETSVQNFLNPLRNTRGCVPITWQSPTDLVPRNYIVNKIKTIPLAGKVFRVELELKEWFG